MANQNNNTKKEEVVEEQKQEQIPENQEKKPEEKPAEKKEEKVVRIAGLEIRRAPKKQKEEKTSEKQPKAKWGVGKAVAVATVGVTAVTGAVKVAGMVCNLLSGRGAGGDQTYEVPAYERQAIEGDYQDVPAADTTSSESES